MDIGIIVAVILFVVGLAFDRGWLPPKYQMIESDPRLDPVTKAAIFKKGPAMRAIVVVPDHVPRYRADGYTPVRVAFGRELRWGRRCVWTGVTSRGTVEECALMARPMTSQASGAPLDASGQEPVYRRLTEVPPGINPNDVTYRFASERQSLVSDGQRPVLDDQGRESRVTDPKGDLLLYWKRGREPAGHN